ncbi:MAG: DUF370 domain-containing protein [Defluviitaleaceae bacterium]|nr:DUF370 domain-containing protein [Defluviitaleaceae bacterium]
MHFKLINVGFGNTVPAERVVAIVGNDSLPVKRAITEARERQMLIDATQGRKTRAVIFTDSSHLVLSALQPETIANRFDPPADGSPSPPGESND